MPSVHAITRAKERFGLNLTVEDLRQIAARISAGLSLPRFRQRDGREQHIVQHRGTLLPVVFDPRNRHIVTVLPIFRVTA